MCKEAYALMYVNIYVGLEGRKDGGKPLTLLCTEGSILRICVSIPRAPIMEGGHVAVCRIFSGCYPAEADHAFNF